MTSFEGIPISETKMTVMLLVYSVLYILILIGGAFLLFSLRSPLSSKEKERLTKLSLLAPNDPTARRELARRERKRKRRKERERQDRILQGFFAAVCLLLALITMITVLLPLVQDLLFKDYRVYEGGLSVRTEGKVYELLLEDGTQLTGTGGLDSDTTQAVVVYGRRSHVTLGAVEKE